VIIHVLPEKGKTGFSTGTLEKDAIAISFAYAAAYQLSDILASVRQHINQFGAEGCKRCMQCTRKTNISKSVNGWAEQG
jgi:hypothetical protein